MNSSLVNKLEIYLENINVQINTKTFVFREYLKNLF